MNLILWRHAEAEDGAPDAGRPLTQRGKQQARDMAGWLNAHLQTPCRLLVSPALRTRTTAGFLGIAPTVEPAVGVGADPLQLLNACQWPDAGGTVVVVGHQPTLGQTAALLLTGSPDYWSVRKGSVWWFSIKPAAQGHRVILRAVMTPDLV